MLPDQIPQWSRSVCGRCSSGHSSASPFSKARYDYVIEIGGKLYRAQVKYADGKHRSISGSVEVNLRKQIKKTRNHRYDENEIDVLPVYVPKIDKICWFRPEIFSGKQGISTRTCPHENCQVKGCIAAEDHLW
jgi:hypothetical protein